MNNFNFISLKVKCPVCNHSLMDEDQKVDNEASIKLNIQTPERTGTIRLSSIYGSYNFSSDIPIDPDTVVVLSCPHCKSSIASTEECSACQAPMSYVLLDIGGKINFCSRKGCKNHNIGFEDLSNALTILYQEFGLQGNYGSEDSLSLKQDKKKKTKDDEHKEILESGSFLLTYCPHCRKSLIEEEMLKIKVMKKNGETGTVLLSPYLNVFSSKSTIFLPEDESVSDFMCFHCDKSLIISDKSCDRCGSNVAKILVGARSKMIDFYICTKKGCTWHGLSKEDLDAIRLDDSLEW